MGIDLNLMCLSADGEKVCFCFPVVVLYSEVPYDVSDLLRKLAKRSQNLKSLFRHLVLLDGESLSVCECGRVVKS